MALLTAKLFGEIDEKNKGNNMKNYEDTIEHIAQSMLEDFKIWKDKIPKNSIRTTSFIFEKSEDEVLNKTMITFENMKKAYTKTQEDEYK